MFETPREWLDALSISRIVADLSSSTLAFDDGGRFQVEIPEVEDAETFQVTLDTADEFGVPVHRVSQGSGITRLLNSELRSFAELGAANHVEVYLFMGVRGQNGYGVQAHSAGGGSAEKRLQGSEQLLYAFEDVRRALKAGIRGFLISDEGLMSALNQLKSLGRIPEDVAIKTSVSMGYGNPAAAALLEDMGADSFNAPVDLPLSTLWSIRQTIDIPIDQYIESPTALGGAYRYYELPEIVRVCAPVNLKFGLSTEQLTDPVGLHTSQLAQLQARERVRLAALGLEILAEAGLQDQVADAKRNRRGVPQKT